MNISLINDHLIKFLGTQIIHELVNLKKKNKKKNIFKIKLYALYSKITIYQFWQRKRQILRNVKLVSDLVVFDNYPSFQGKWLLV